MAIIKAEGNIHPMENYRLVMLNGGKRFAFLFQLFMLSFVWLITISTAHASEPIEFLRSALSVDSTSSKTDALDNKGAKKIKTSVTAEREVLRKGVAEINETNNPSGEQVRTPADKIKSQNNHFVNTTLKESLSKRCIDALDVPSNPPKALPVSKIHRVEPIAHYFERARESESVPISLWESLDALYEFLSSFSIYQGELEIVKIQDYFTLKSMLRQNPNLPTQIAMKLRNIENNGYVPDKINLIIKALIHLTKLSNGSRVSDCQIIGCDESFRIGVTCLFKDCSPQVKKEEHYLFDGSIDVFYYIEYPVLLELWGMNVILWEKRELELDEGTKIIRAQNTAGLVYIETLIERAKEDARKGKPWAFVFMDLNNLGLINYFWEGPPAGDEYIAAYAESVKTQLLPTDHFFRVGGDEFVIMSENRRPENLKSFLKKIAYHFFSNKKANRVFSRQWAMTEKAINAIGRFKTSEALKSSHYSNILQTHWREEADLNFSQFKKEYQQRYKEELQKHLRWHRFLMRPSFSAGSKYISDGDTFLSLKADTNDQSRETKKIYKENQGASAVKVGGASTNEDLIEENIDIGRIILPPIFDPL